MIIDDTTRFQSITEERKGKIQIVCSAYDSVLAKFAYASASITTGPLFYDVLEHYGVKTLDELKAKNPKAAYEEIIRPNLDNGIAFAKRLVPKSQHPVLSPSIFEATKDRWTQDEYMFLWYHVLDHKVTTIHMGPGWNYSNGQTEEYLRAMQIWYRLVREDRGTAIFDHDGNPIPIDRGAGLLADAITDLAGRGFRTDTLLGHLKELHGCTGVLTQYGTSAHDYHYHMPPDFTHEQASMVWQSRRRAEAVAA